MKGKIEKYKSADEFGKALGLSRIDMELIRQKRKLIEKLRKAREHQGLSQAELAKMVSSKQPAIARMESGQVSEVSLDFLCKVAMALEIPFTIKPKAA
ncbi:MAG: helix-turn-helix transcriptional regulator [Bdellovibrionales bacterium]|jgi:ribosome-binding protein aMBF1 (putative translation factor)|nr:helix-turn-helix transcriptional regulator [Bdellovibrionales bacterium]